MITLWRQLSTKINCDHRFPRIRYAPVVDGRHRTCTTGRSRMREKEAQIQEFLQFHLVTEQGIENLLHSYWMIACSEPSFRRMRREQYGTKRTDAARVSLKFGVSKRCRKKINKFCSNINHRWHRFRNCYVWSSQGRFCDTSDGCLLVRLQKKINCCQTFSWVYKCSFSINLSPLQA